MVSIGVPKYYSYSLTVCETSLEKIMKFNEEFNKKSYMTSHEYFKNIESFIYGLDKECNKLNYILQPDYRPVSSLQCVIDEFFDFLKRIMCAHSYGRPWKKETLDELKSKLKYLLNRIINCLTNIIEKLKEKGCKYEIQQKSI
jgi:hypothetical protein